MSEVTCVGPWFGSNRMLAEQVAIELEGCEWIGVTCAGGMSEVAKMKARTINVNDLHWHVINLAQVMADRQLGPKLYRAVRRKVFHPAELDSAQFYCSNLERLQKSGRDPMRDESFRLEWAENYFVAAWMSRHGSAGTKSEFTGGMSTRWSAGGGDSAAHFQGAIRAIPTLRRTLRRCNFTTLDFREFLGECLKRDRAKHGIYTDPPFFGPGDKYSHRFSKQDHCDLAELHSKFEHTRVVVRCYDIPLMRELYPQPRWHWRHLSGRKQTNDEAPEVLIINGPSYAKDTA